MSYHKFSLVIDLQALESFYEQYDPDFINIRTKAREVLQREDDLNEIVQVCFFQSFNFPLTRITAKLDRNEPFPCCSKI